MMISRKLISIFFLAFLLFGCGSQEISIPSALSNEVFSLSKSGSTRATGYADSNKIIETDQSIFISWLGNSNSNFEIEIVEFNKESGTFSEVITVSTDVDDNHGGPALAIDSDGYLHMLYGPHASPMRYVKSLRPFDISEWTEPVSFGTNLTYPSLAIDSNNTLYCVARQSNWHSDWPLLLFKKEADSDWSGGTEILIGNYPDWKNQGMDFNTYPTNGYTRYSKSLVVDSQDKLHLSFKIAEYLPDQITSDSQFESGISFYLIGYMYSDDQGISWQTNSSTASLPVKVDQVEVIDGSTDPTESSAIFDISNMVVGQSGIPYVSYSVATDTGSDFMLAYKENNSWSKINISEKFDSEEEFLLAPASIAIDNVGAIYIMATSIPETQYCKCLDTWANPANEIRLFKLTGDELDVIDYDQSLITQRPLWLPSAQHQSFDSNPPSFMFLSGGSSQSNDDKIENEVIFVHLQ